MANNPALEKLLEIKSMISVFSGLENEDIKSIVTNVNFQKFAVMETIIYERDTDNLVYFMLKGSCDVIVNRQVVGRLERGALFGEMSTILQKPRVASVKATTMDTTVISFNILIEDLSINYKAFSILLKNVAVELSKKVDNVNKLLIS